MNKKGSPSILRRSFYQHLKKDKKFEFRCCVGILHNSTWCLNAATVAFPAIHGMDDYHAEGYHLRCALHYSAPNGEDIDLEKLKVEILQVIEQEEIAEKINENSPIKIEIVEVGI